MTTPQNRLIRTSIDAELAARDWLRYWGFPDAELTEAGADGGVDVRTADAIAQVKAEVRPIGRPEVQQLAGIASHEGRVPLFFSLGRFTTQAEEWASEARVALFTFDLSGMPQPLNDVAYRTLSDRSVGNDEVPPAWRELSRVAESMMELGTTCRLEGWARGIDRSSLETWFQTTWWISYDPPPEHVPDREPWTLFVRPSTDLQRTFVGEYEDFPFHATAEGAWVFWNVSTETASEAARRLAAVLQRESLSADHFETTVVTEEDEEARDLEQKGTPIHVVDVKDLQQQLWELHRLDHSAEVTAEWATDRESRQWVEANVGGEWVRPGFSVYMARRREGRWIVLLQWSSVPNRFASHFSGFEADRIVEGFGHWALDIGRVRRLSATIKPQLAAMNLDLSNFDLFLRDGGVNIYA